MLPYYYYGEDAAGGLVGMALQSIILYTTGPKSTGIVQIYIYISSSPNFLFTIGTPLISHIVQYPNLSKSSWAIDLVSPNTAVLSLIAGNSFAGDQT